MALSPFVFGTETGGSGGVGGAVVFRIVYVAWTSVPLGRHASARAAIGGPWFYLRLGRRDVLPLLPA